MKLKWLIKTPTSFGNSERSSLNVVLFQLLRCLCNADTVPLFPELLTNHKKEGLNLFISKNNNFWKQTVTVREQKIKLGRESSSYRVVTPEQRCRCWCCVTLSSVVCCFCERLCDKGRREHSALSCAVKGTECALIHKPSNCLQTRLQSSSIKTLCLAYQNKSQHRAEYQISPLERWSTRSLATSGI